MPKFPPTSGFKWVDLTEFVVNKYSSNSSKERSEYPKELREWKNDYILAPDKLEIKRECCLSIN